MRSRSGRFSAASIWEGRSNPSVTKGSSIPCASSFEKTDSRSMAGLGLLAPLSVAEEGREDTIIIGRLSLMRGGWQAQPDCFETTQPRSIWSSLQRSQPSMSMQGRQ